VVTAALVGGRDPAGQVRLVPWGDDRGPCLSDGFPDPGPVGPEPDRADAPGGGSARGRAEAVWSQGWSQGQGREAAAGQAAAQPMPDGGEVGDEQRLAPAGWPADVVREHGRVPAVEHGVRERPTNRRRRVSVPRRSVGGAALRDPAPGWPGRLPAPSPAVVYPGPRPAELIDAAGRPVLLTAPDLLSAPPQDIVVDGGEPQPVAGWAGPWPVWQRWWSPGEAEVARLQVVLPGGALLLHAREGRWWVMGSYD
jgi:protein ImuB